METVVEYFKIKQCYVCKNVLSRKVVAQDSWLFKDKYIFEMCRKECYQQRPVKLFITSEVKIINKNISN